MGSRGGSHNAKRGVFLRSGADAFAREKRKQMISEVAKTCGFTVKQVVGFHKHFQEMERHSTSSMLDSVPDELQVDHAQEFADQFFKDVNGASAIDTAKALEQRRARAAITFSEYMLGVAYLVRHADIDEKVRFLFQFYDGDKDGNLTFKEFVAMVEGNSKNVPGRAEALYTFLKKHFLKIDDGDGLISFFECVDVIKAHECLQEHVQIDVDNVLKSIRDRRKEIERIDGEFPTASS